MLAHYGWVDSCKALQPQVSCIDTDAHTNKDLRFACTIVALSLLRKYYYIQTVFSSSRRFYSRRMSFDSHLRAWTNTIMLQFALMRSTNKSTSNQSATYKNKLNNFEQFHTFISLHILRTFFSLSISCAGACILHFVIKEKV